MISIARIAVSAALALALAFSVAALVPPAGAAGCGAAAKGGCCGAAEGSCCGPPAGCGCDLQDPAPRSEPSDLATGFELPGPSLRGLVLAAEPADLFDRGPARLGAFPSRGQPPRPAGRPLLAIVSILLI